MKSTRKVCASSAERGGAERTGYIFIPDWKCSVVDQPHSEWGIPSPALPLHFRLWPLLFYCLCKKRHWGYFYISGPFRGALDLYRQLGSKCELGFSRSPANFSRIVSGLHRWESHHLQALDLYESLWKIIFHLPSVIKAFLNKQSIVTTEETIKSPALCYLEVLCVLNLRKNISNPKLIIQVTSSFLLNNTRKRFYEGVQKRNVDSSFRQ